MIISRTPFRISFFGGGTDYPGWFRERGGAVLATTMDKYCYISVRVLPPFFAHRYRLGYSVGEGVLARTMEKFCYISVRVLPPFFAHRYRLVYSVVESVVDVSEIQHPAARAVLPSNGFDKQGLELHHDGDLPARSGLGSSSSFTVGLINALTALE